MLSSVLRSPRAFAVNLGITPAFGPPRRAALASQQRVADERSRRLDARDSAIRELLKTISRPVEQPSPQQGPIGSTLNRDGPVSWGCRP